MTAAAPAAPARSGNRLAALAPATGRAEITDVAVLLALTLLGILGFRAAYGGHDYLIVGATGAVLGLALSYAGHRVRLPLLAICAVAVLLFLVIGAVVAQTGIGSQIPSISAMHTVIATTVYGWKQLLTTARPVGTTAHLLVLPFLLGLASAVAGHALATRTKRVLLPAAPPAAVVALSILLGADHATAAFLQGAAFAGLALAWAALRQQRYASSVAVIGRQQPWYRIGASLIVLAIAVTGGALIGPALPGAHAHQRVVLHVVPPFNVNAYPSPLGGFRNYTKDAAPGVSVYGRKLLSTTGLQVGDLVRIATMDTYNGLVWGFSNAAGGRSSFTGFQRIGAVLPGAASHPARTATITIDQAYQLPWLPDLPGTTEISFGGQAGTGAASALRFNVATGTGIVPDGVPPGLRYTVGAASAPVLPVAQLAHATPYGTPVPFTGTPAEIQSFASAHSGDASAPVGRALALASYLKSNGEYSNGGGVTNVLPGHSAGRLTEFLSSLQIIGDGEQYAAAMALLAIAAGVPARVALDGAVESSGSVYGRDVRADVELDLAQYGWVTLPASDFTGTRPATPQPLSTPHPAPAKVVPPPVSNTAPVASQNESNAVSRRAPDRKEPHAFRLPAFLAPLVKGVVLPLLILAAIAGALAGAKTLRRRRRRTRGPAAARVSGAWREMLDVGRDLGIAPAAGLTRREHAAEAERLGLPGTAVLAAAVDSVVFGRADPDEAAAARIWALTEQIRRSALASLRRWRRVWVTLNPASLRAGRTVSQRLGR